MNLGPQRNFIKELGEGYLAVTKNFIREINAEIEADWIAKKNIPSAKQALAFAEIIEASLEKLVKPQVETYKNDSRSDLTADGRYMERD